MYWRGYELPNNLHILEARGKFSVIVHELAIALATAELSLLLESLSSLGFWETNLRVSPAG